MSETPVLFNITAASLMMIESHQNIAKYRLTLTAFGIMDVVPGSPFHELVANFGEKRAQMPKRMLVEVCGCVKQCVLHVGPDAEGDKIDPMTTQTSRSAKGNHGRLKAIPTLEI